METRDLENIACPFTGNPCDGGTIHDDGRIGCVFKQSPDSDCEWMDELPAWQSPRDYYNEKVLEAMNG